MKKLLITGGTVFVSMYTAKYFAEAGNDVYVLNRNTRKQVDGVTLIECDRNNIKDELRGLQFDAVIDINAYNEEHVKKLLDSLDSFDDYIFISSSAVYPETNKQPFTEDQICGYNSVWGDYGINKLNAEKYLFKNASNAYILRPPYLYGETENLYRELFVFDCAEQNRKFYLPPESDMKLQFFHVKDLCRMIQIILEKHPEEHIINVGNYDLITVKEWVRLCYEAAGKNPPEFINVQSVDEQRNYFCFRNYEYVLDVSIQKKYLPDTVDISEGLKSAYQWYKDNRNYLADKNYFQTKNYFQYIDEYLK